MKELKNKSEADSISNRYRNPDIFIGDIQKLTEYQNLEEIKEPSKEQTDRKKKLSEEIVMMYGLENGIWAANLAHAKYYSALAQIRKNIVRDFGCKTSLEFMLVDRIVAHYWRAMRSDTLLNHYMENEDGSFSVNQLRINMVKEFNRGIDRADRQLNANIILLKELKQPKMNIKVTTENAYIAQNQQVNSIASNEIIEPK